MVDGTDTSTASTDPGTACTDTVNGITDTGTATGTASTDTGIEGTETCKVPSSTAGPNMKKKIIAGVALILVIVALSALAVVLASGEKKVTIDASEQNNTKSGIQDEKTTPQSETAPPQTVTPSQTEVTTDSDKRQPQELQDLTTTTTSPTASPTTATTPPTTETEVFMQTNNSCKSLTLLLSVATT